MGVVNGFFHDQHNLIDAAFKWDGKLKTQCGVLVLLCIDETASILWSFYSATEGKSRVTGAGADSHLSI